MVVKSHKLMNIYYNEHLQPSKHCWRRKCLPTPVFMHGKSHGQRTLVGYSPWGCELDMTEQLTLSSAVISTLSIISFLHSSQQHSEESCVIAPILSLRKLMLQFSHSVMSNSLTPHGLLHARLPCPSPTIGACSNSCPLSR